MFRVRSADALSDMTNLSRAKDAAIAAALRVLNSKVQEKAPRGTHVREKRSELGAVLPDTNRIMDRPGAASAGSSS
jgi:hypothetical protein